ncbi:TPR-like protein [Pholiota conissans]|uniref:TPR-like protein n=1 Tax=Pholiota conissans TaxID=109636 RepID=A0A9P6D1W4_9AGAR|nr:TPR-like protein [Pholiota conissans]
MPSTPPPASDASVPDPSKQTNAKTEAPQAEVNLEQANVLKAEGTEAFRAGRWSEALASYQAALRCLPKRIVVTEDQPTRDNIGDDGDGEPKYSSSAKDKGKAKENEKEKEKKEKAEDVVDVSSPAVSAADKEMTRLRAVLHANVGACFVKLGDHKEAAQACSQAILDDPAYVKARERRAASNEIIGSWTSLTSAQEDYTALLQLHTTSAQLADVRRKLQSLKPRLEAAQKRETDEMLGKLKGLGNTILGNFGLSTDNFKFEPNGAGGYSLNFTRS